MDFRPQTSFQIYLREGAVKRDNYFTAVCNYSKLLAESQAIFGFLRAAYF